MIGLFLAEKLDWLTKGSHFLLLNSVAQAYPFVISRFEHSIWVQKLISKPFEGIWEKPLGFSL
jgi:hypothetical protein